MKRGTAPATRAALAALLAAAAVLGLAAPSRGQTKSIRFDRLTTDDGLSQGDVHVIHQDRVGFMWFGTQDGLNRYDGYTFTQFKHDPRDPTSLSNNWIYALIEDRDGVIWVGTMGGGLNRLDRERGTFSRFRSDPSNPNSLSSDRVRVLIQDRDGFLWIGTDGSGINRFDPATGSFKRFAHNPGNPASLSHDKVRSILEDRAGMLWVGTDGGGLSRLDPATGTFLHFLPEPGQPGGVPSSRVREIFEDRDGRLWVATYEDGLFLFDPETETAEQFVYDPESASSLSSDRVRTIFQDDQGTIWIGTDNGLNEWEPARGTFLRYLSNPGDPGSLADNRVLSISQDRGGVLWVGLQGGGLNKWNTRSGFFDTFKSDPSQETGLNTSVVSSITEDPSGAVWVGTYGGGLNRIDPETGVFSYFRHDPADPRSLTDDRVMSLFSDGQGQLWVGTLEGGLNLFHPESGRFSHYLHDPEDPHSLSQNGITVIRESSDGYLWVGTMAGLNRFDRATETFVRYQHNPSNPTSLGSNRVLAIYEDRSGVLWVGTIGAGLNRFDRRSGTFTHYSHDPERDTSLSSDAVMAVYEDSSSVLWIGTQSGLNRWDPEDRLAHRGVFTRFFESDGLPNNSIWGILEDNAGHLWMSTNKGLTRFNPEKGTFKNFDVSHGLQGNDFNNGAYYKSPSGRMFFGGNQGFNSFYPERIRENSSAPSVVLTNILKLNTPMQLDVPVSEIEELELTHQDPVVSFEFAALDYTAPEKNRYAYMLEGFDAGWIDLGTIRRATYTNLDSGEYVFRVRGANNDGTWSHRGASLRVKVIPPPWRSWWAYVLYSLAGLLVILAYTRAQAMKLQREAEYSRKLEEDVRARTAELAERNRELHNAKRRFEEASLTDSLTGLRNRRFLFNNIERDLALVERYYTAAGSNGRRRPELSPDFIFLLFDLDGFKEVNDTYGHAAGDRVLVQVRELLQAACRKSDSVVRWGGDEFLVVGRNTDRRTGEQLAERIRRAVAAHRFDIGREEPARMTCSIGLTGYPFIAARPSLLNWEQVINIADRALYLAKQNGRDGWVALFSTETSLQAGSDDLPAAISQDPQGLVRDGHLEMRASFDQRLQGAAAS